MKRTMTLLLISLLMLSGLTITTQAQPPLPQSVCLITDVGLLNDGGFNQSAYDGLQLAVADYGLEDTFIETQSPTDYETNINTCLDAGFDIIITVGFALADATLAAAEINPDQYFIGVDQDFLTTDGPPNLVGLQFREDQGGFLAGVMAALMTESGIVGGLYGPNDPPVLKFGNGFSQGVAYIDPEITVLENYSLSYETPTEGREVALTMLGDGADVVFGAGGRHSVGGIRQAAEEGALVIGVDTDQYITEFGAGDAPGADRIVTSVVKGIDEGVYDMIVAAVEGEGFPADNTYVMEIANNGIDFTESHDADVPEAVTERMEQTLAGLGEGRIVTGVDPVTGELLPSLTQVAQEADLFETLITAAREAGLFDTLSEEGPFLVFAPTDDAFEAALDELNISVEELLNDTEMLEGILLYHVADRALDADLIVGFDGESLEMLNGGFVDVSVTDDGVVLNDDINITQTDVLAGNGIIHVIDGVLIPE
jgi:basic membrane protein A and related proteins